MASDPVAIVIKPLIVSFQYIHEGYRFLVVVDIKGFFDNIPHDVFMKMLRAEIADRNILDIIQTFLSSSNCGLVKQRPLY
ncbi:MAG: hypothetical protein H0T62_07215 [Parachlamydiaceae bacterium]|nr:hypothetical protein [Parachlamydiaceae bacterium]